MSQALGLRRSSEDVEDEGLASPSHTWEGVRGPTGPSGGGRQLSQPRPLTSCPLKDQDFNLISCFMSKTAMETPGPEDPSPQASPMTLQP